MRIDFVSLFPEMVLGAARHSMLRRAEEAGIVEFHGTNPRDFTTDKHRTVDDNPFGGGPGMVMKVEPVAAALNDLDLDDQAAIVLTNPTGTRFSQKVAAELATRSRMVLLCGHYEGFDHRIQDMFATHVVSIGDFILTGGELPALVIADAVVRLLPGVLGSEESLQVDSHANGLLSAPNFTHPAVFEGHEVPEVLRSGNHKAVTDWRRLQALRLTRELRPDLFCKAELDRKDLDMLSS